MTNRAQGHIRRYEGPRGVTYRAIVPVGTYENGSAKYEGKSFKTRAQANHWRVEALGRLQTGQHVSSSKITTEQFLKEWLAAKEPHLRASTFDSYKSEIHNHVIPRIGSIAVQNLTPKTLTALYGDLMTSGRKDGHGGLSSQTVAYISTILYQALDAGVRHGQLFRNVAAAADRPKAATDHREMQTWTSKEVRTFLESVTTDRHYPVYVLACTTGMRRGELLALRWRDLDLDAGRLSVSQSLSLVRFKIVFYEPKTKRSRRSIALDPFTITVLKAQRKKQLEERVALGAWPENDLVFTTALGDPIHPESLTTAFQKHIKRIELQRIRFHDLRHSYATLALKNGEHPKVVQERLGHASVSTTLNVYSHVMPEQDAAVANRIAALITG